MNKEIKTFLIDNDEACAYNVHFEKEPEFSKIYFYAYPVILWENIKNEHGISYKGKTTPDEDLFDIFDEEKALMKFQGSTCWRGEWESRVYFTDEEYWGSEIEEMAKLFKLIESHCKSLFKNGCDNE